MRKLLITGVPGTGKTEIGNYLKDKHGYLHIDMEQGGLAALISNPIAFFKKIYSDETNVVITWGFVPDEEQTQKVLDFRENGYTLFWFDGNRESALKEFNNRGDVAEYLFHIQIGGIDKFGLPGKITPTIYNPFNTQGVFKEKKQITDEIFGLDKV